MFNILSFCSSFWLPILQPQHANVAYRAAAEWLADFDVKSQTSLKQCMLYYLFFANLAIFTWLSQGPQGQLNSPRAMHGSLHEQEEEDEV